MIVTLLQLCLVFGRLSILAVGGLLPILPELHQLVVGQYHWVTDAQFRDAYSLGQVTPGPGSLMVTVIGYRAAGLPGALVATLAMFLPTCALTLAIGKNWDRFAGSPWRLALQRGLGPVTLGLIFGGVYALARTAILSPGTAGIALAATAFLLRSRISPALLVLAGGIAGGLILK